MSTAVDDELDDYEDDDDDDLDDEPDEWQELLDTAAVLANPEPWRARAACSDWASFEVFFPTRGELTNDAKAVCDRCPVATECLEFALSRVIRIGVWGGTAERWRRRERHRRRCTDEACTEPSTRRSYAAGPWVGGTGVRVTLATPTRSSPQVVC